MALATLACFEKRRSGARSGGHVFRRVFRVAESGLAMPRHQLAVIGQFAILIFSASAYLTENGNTGKQRWVPAL